MNARRPLFLSAFCLLVFSTRPGFGIEPEKMEGVVYRLNSFAVTEYALVYSSPQADEISLIADSDNAFDPRYTLIYYWPLTREYFQSWETLDVELEGRLEVLQDNRLLQALERVPVAFYYPRGSAAQESRLLWGEEARRKSAEYAALDQRYRQAMTAFGEQMIRYQRELREYMRKSRQAPAARDAAAGDLPRPPAEPQPPGWFISELRETYVVRLPQGSYAVRVRAADGTIVDGSERRLTVTAPVAGSGIGYEILAEERWTARLRADTEESGIYCLPESDFFLIPYATQAYREDHFGRLRNPQAKGLTERPAYVYTRPLEGRPLVLLQGGKVVRRLDLKPYYVQQAQGADLGYRITEYDRQAAGGRSPAFSAYRLRFEKSQAGRKFFIALEDPATGRIAAGSRREVRIVGGRGGTGLWLACLLPLLFGACVFFWRRKTAWSPGRRPQG